MVWRRRKNGCESTVVPDETCSLPHNTHGGPTLKKISKRGGSIVCTTDGGERRIVERWGDKETSQGLPQEGQQAQRFRKFWGLLSDQRCHPQRTTSCKT